MDRQRALILISIFKEMWAPPKASDSIELTRLYRSIEDGLQQRHGASVAIASPHRSDQVLRLSYDLAWVGSTLLGKRVLVLDTTGQAAGAPVMHEWNPAPRPGPVSRAAEVDPIDPPPKQALVEMDRALQERGSTGILGLRISPARNHAVAPQLNEIWGKLKGSFDLILVAAPPVLDDPTAAALGTVVDGNVLLVSSGRSRQGDVSRAIELLSGSATPLIGVVMTDRRHTYPRWLRWMFRRRR